jgi:hypothetical protein
MIIGSVNPQRIPDFVTNSRFAVVDEVKILGVKFTKNADDIAQNFESAIDKIRKTANFWMRFNLSLIGRINVAKTFMLSQLGYLGTIFTPTEIQIATINTLIKDFVCGTLNISKNNFTMCAKKGGLGMIDIDEFLCSLKCTWVKRCINSKIDNWHLDLNIATHNNPTTFSQFDEWTTSSSWAEGISISLESLTVCFSLLNDNFLHSSLSGNPLLINDLRAKQKFNLGLIPVPNNNSWVKRRSLIISDLLDFEGNVLPVNLASNVLECNLDGEQYNLLKKAITDSKTWCERKKIQIDGIVSSTLATFFQRFKKGSKPIRKIFEHCRNEKINVRHRQNI